MASIDLIGSRLNILRQRIHPRYLRAGLTVVISSGGLAAQLAVTLITTPWLLKHLGRAGFGLWATLYSLVSMCSFLDFGIGFGLVSILAQCYGRDDRDSAARYVSSAVWSVSVIAALFLSLFLLFGRYVSWAQLFNVSGPSAVDARHGVYAVAIAVALALPLSLVVRIQAAYQRGYINSAWDIVARVALIVSVAAAIRLNATIPQILGLFLFFPIVGYLISGVVLVFFQDRALRPTLAHLNSYSVKAVFRGGFMFFVLQLVTAVGFSSDNLIIARVLGPSAVADFAVPRTLFQMVITGCMLFLNPLWPAYGDAIARGEWQWIRRVLGWSVALASAGSLVGAGVVALIAPPVINIWMGKSIQVSPGLLAAFVAWTAATSGANAISMLLNAAMEVRLQVIAGVIVAVLALVMKVAMGHAFGLAGILWGGTLVLLACDVLPLLFVANRLVNARASASGETPKSVEAQAT
jgi:O-antigen/teichoic acid export membrane protein